ncbi:MAG: hypothetical protein ACW99H_09215, partial [Candidatus Thorarchaeota archaeon]
LRYINLVKNRLKHIDLSPLSSCPRLTKLLLHHNKELGTMDMTPLQFLPGLEEIRFHRSKITDISAWIKWAFINTGRGRVVRDQDRSGGSGAITIAPPAPEDSWELLHKMSCIPRTYSIPIQDYIQRSLGLTHLGLVDSDISNILQSIPPESTLDEARETIFPVLIERVGEQIERGGTTIGLEVDESWNIGEMATKVKEVFALRNAEMNGTVIFRIVSDRWAGNYGRFDVSGLWITAYGFDILTSLGLTKKRVMNEHLEDIRRLLDEVGYEMEVVDVEEPKDLPLPKKKEGMSAAMMNYILALSAHSFQYTSRLLYPFIR